MQQTNSASQVRIKSIIAFMNNHANKTVQDTGTVFIAHKKWARKMNYEFLPFPEAKAPEMYRLYLDGIPTLFTGFKFELKKLIQNSIVNYGEAQ